MFPVSVILINRSAFQTICHEWVFILPPGQAWDSQVPSPENPRLEQPDIFNPMGIKCYFLCVSWSEKAGNPNEIQTADSLPLHSRFFYFLKVYKVFRNHGNSSGFTHFEDSSRVFSHSFGHLIITLYWHFRKNFNFHILLNSATKNNSNN